MDDDGRAYLQKYMDALQPALNAALNQLARERPEEPVKALAKLLDPGLAKQAARATQRRVGDDSKPFYTPSAALRLMMDHSSSECCKMPAEEVVHELIQVGALTESGKAKRLWQNALQHAKQRAKGENAWAKYGLHKHKTELAKRWDYDPGGEVWKCSETLIKMEEEPFAKGAMRECFRMKKMSQYNAHFFFNVRPRRLHADAPPLASAMRRVPRWRTTSGGPCHKHTCISYGHRWRGKTATTTWPSGTSAPTHPGIFTLTILKCRWSAIAPAHNYVHAPDGHAGAHGRAHATFACACARAMRMYTWAAQVSKRYAKLYNVKEPPKGVDFLMAFVLEVRPQVSATSSTMPRITLASGGVG